MTTETETETKSETKNKSNKDARPGVIMGGTGERSEKLDSITGQPRERKTEVVTSETLLKEFQDKAKKFFVSQEALTNILEEEADFWEKKGYAGRAAQLRGKKYDPTFGQRVRSSGARAVDALITVAIVAVPGALLLWVGNQFLRLVSKKLREKLPEWGIHYEPEMEEKKRLR